MRIHHFCPARADVYHIRCGRHRPESATVLSGRFGAVSPPCQGNLPMGHAGPTGKGCTNSSADKHFVLLTIAGHDLALPHGNIQEVVHYPALVTAPSLPAFVKGFLNLGGSPIAVIDIAQLLRLRPNPVHLYSPILILRGFDHPQALLVESVQAVVRTTQELLVPVPPDHTFQDCAVGAIQWSNRLHCVLDVRRLLLKEEQERLTALQMVARERLDHLTEAAS